MSPTGWTITGCGCGTRCWDSLKPDVQTYVGNIATEIMWAATGRQFGLTTITVRPCTRPILDPAYVDYPTATDALYGAYIRDGAWYDVGLGGNCGTACTCTARCEVAIDGLTSKANITSVKVNGVTVDPSAYMVQNGGLLIRTDGTCWPTCGDVGAATADFEVTYAHGRAVPGGVQQATNRLACELARGCAGDDSCRLPNRIRSLTRQGVEVQLSDLAADLAKSINGGPTGIRTGIPEVDMIIDVYNPRAMPQAATVWSPDLPHPRMVTP